MAMLDDVKVAVRLTTDAFDREINSLIEAAKADLGIAGVVLPNEMDDICKRAIITYCRMNFSYPDGGGHLNSSYDRMKSSYDEQKAQLSTATGYTDWGDEDDSN